MKVALSLAPILMDGLDQRLGVLNPEGINLWEILSAHASTLQAPRRIQMLGMIAITKLKRPAQRAQFVVVGFLALRLIGVRDAHQQGALDLQKGQGAQVRAPN